MSLLIIPVAIILAVELWSEEWMNELDKNVSSPKQGKGQSCISQMDKWYDKSNGFWEPKPWKRDLMQLDGCGDLFEGDIWKVFGNGPLAFVGDSTLGYALRSFLTNSTGPHVGPIFSTVKTSQRTGTEHYVFEHPSLNYKIEVYWFGYFTFETITQGWDNILSYKPTRIFISSGLHDPHPIYKRKHAQNILDGSEAVFATLDKWVPEFVNTATKDTNPPVFWLETIAPWCDGLRWYSKKRSKLTCYMFHRFHSHLRTTLLPKLRDSNRVVVIPSRHISTWEPCLPGDGIHLPQYCNQIVISHLALAVHLVDSYGFTAAEPPTSQVTKNQTRVHFAVTPSHLLRLTMPVVCILVANFGNIRLSLVLLVATMVLDGVMPRVVLTGDLLFEK
eukprot:TRINITY_DN13043_c0_g1_i1.p1 TRINITY_DN13043_c0_g1~~TRINITY_DN13043_c0_g1_i1.p1  ORF type:complete len:389 (+),score=30.97 TRINITY_DN13043_c0_g1_i1:91-1257(+)